VQKCNNNNLNSKNSFFNKKSSYKQLPFSQNKIILDNMKDKYNTINEVNNKKRIIMIIWMIASTQQYLKRSV
jgi:hypothetical protein